MTDIPALLADLKRDEGFVPHAYADTLGYTTIGYGRMIDARRDGGLTPEEAGYLLENDVGRVLAGLRAALPWYDLQPEPVQRALANMAYQLGLGSKARGKGLLGFTTTLDHIAYRHYAEAAESAGRSLWARQTPERARRVLDLIRSAGP